MFLRISKSVELQLWECLDKLWIKHWTPHQRKIPPPSPIVNSCHHQRLETCKQAAGQNSHTAQTHCGLLKRFISSFMQSFSWTQRLLTLQWHSVQRNKLNADPRDQHPRLFNSTPKHSYFQFTPSLQVLFKKHQDTVPVCRLTQIWSTAEPFTNHLTDHFFLPGT